MLKPRFCVSSWIGDNMSQMFSLIFVAQEIQANLQFCDTYRAFREKVSMHGCVLYVVHYIIGVILCTTVGRYS